MNRRNFLGHASGAMLACVAVARQPRLGFQWLVETVSMRERVEFGAYVSRDLQDQWVQRQEYEAFGVLPN